MKVPDKENKGGKRTMVLAKYFEILKKFFEKVIIF